MSAKTQLSASEFMQMVQMGHARLAQNVEQVNALNIFPVPDGDTGTNMEMSLAAGVQRFSPLSTASSVTLLSVVQSLCTGLLMGARGNSGVILSQLFRGFIKVAQKQTQLTVTSFATALQEGVHIAYQAVAKPVEGTILTVAREAAAEGARLAKQQPDLVLWLENVCSAAQRALARTPELLPVLKQAGVVDSGGTGLLYIYQGWLAYLRGEAVGFEGLPVSDIVPQLANLDYAAAHVHQEGEFGYCTEVLVRMVPNQSSIVPQLRQTLETYGDSLLVVASDEWLKVHVHTLHPGRVVEDAMGVGTLVKVKIENMTEQHDQLINDTHRVQVQDSSSLPLLPAQEATRRLSVVAVAAGDGLREVFESLGVDIIISGGQTMNPSTEDIVSAIRTLSATETLVLPNNKNIILAAEQAKTIVGHGVHVIPSTTIVHGIAAMMAFQADADAATNVRSMVTALADVVSGTVVRAVRDSTFQEQWIQSGQYMGFVDQYLVAVSPERTTAAMQVISQMGADSAELITVFYGADVNPLEAQTFAQVLRQSYAVEVECKFGGQPVYDFIFSLE